MTPLQRRLYRARYSLLIIGLSLLFLQSCRQNPQPPPNPTITNPAPTLFSANSAVSNTSTPLPIPATASPAALETAVPTPTPATTAPQQVGQVIIGYSVQNRPIIAHWAGSGSIKVVIIGGHSQTTDRASLYLNDPDQVPADLTLWFIPTPNPDNPDPNNLLNANGVNIFQNADTRFTNCSGRSETGQTNGTFPFSEPESQALRTFLADSWIALFLTADFKYYQPGGCGLHPPGNALAYFWANINGTAISHDATTNHHFIDYLAGQGTAAAIINPETFTSDVLASMLDNVGQIMEAAALPTQDEFQWVNQANSGLWQFPAGTLIHPLALEQLGDQLYLLDSGQVQLLNRQNPTMPTVILAPDHEVAGVRVIEPLDLAVDGRFLLVLDRAGDVYAYDPQTSLWTLRRYDRPIDDTSTHYYLALTSQPASDQTLYLLEGSYHLAINQRPGQPDYIWPLPEDHQIDISVNNEDVYVLSQPDSSQTAELTHYRNGVTDNDFLPAISLHRPRQIQAAGSLVYVLDNNGRRLTALDAVTGALVAMYLPADGKPLSAFHIDEGTGQILLIGQDRLWFYGQPAQTVVIPGTGPYQTPQIYDPGVLETLPGLLMPIGGSDIAVRENQMPGAPRHYRLGIHEGADFYWQSGTAVRAVAAGTVIRATLDYQLPSQERFDNWWNTVQALGYTSPEAHDFYRGRQVWIEHEGGLISRYVHLSAVDGMIQEGTTVQAGQIIGAVGNTGSPVSLEGPNTDAHLHFELWLADHYLGQFLRPIETREWLKIILNEQ